MSLEVRLERLQREYLLGSKGFTKAGIRKLIARLHEELAAGGRVWHGPGLIHNAQEILDVLKTPGTAA